MKSSILQMAAELKELAPMRQFVEAAALALKVNPAAIPQVLLAVNEIVTNVIVHGYRGQGGTIEIEVAQEGQSLVIRVRDQAQLFNPTRVPPPDLSLPLDQRPLGGMGIYLTRYFTDAMSHRVTAEGGNELTLVKKGIINNY
jgi:serine/threonine-protein kinase RsbW